MARQRHTPSEFIETITEGQEGFGPFDIDGDVVLKGFETTSTITLYDLKIEGNFTISTCKFQQGIKLVNCTIDGAVTIENSEIGGELEATDTSRSLLWTGLKTTVDFHIINSIFLTPFFIMDSKLSSLDIVHSSFKADFKLYDSTIEDEIEIKQSEISVLNFETCQFKGYLALISLNCKHIHFDEIETNGECTLEELELTESLQIENSLFKKHLEFDKSKVEALSITNSKVERDLVVENLSAKNMTFENNSVGQVLELTRLNVEHELNLNECELKGGFNISGLRCKEIVLDGLVSPKYNYFTIDDLNKKDEKDVFKGQIDQLEIFEGNYDRGFLIELGKNKLPKLHISLTPSFTGVIMLENGTIHHLEIGGFNKQGHIYFYKTLVGLLYINNFSNEGQLTFSQLRAFKEKKSQLRIIKSVLGQTRFVNMDLNKLGKIDIADSFLEDISYSNTDWFDLEQLNIPIKTLTARQEEIFTAQKREVFRQLKYAAEKQGDRAQALRFKAQEYTIYRQLLRYKIDSLKSRSQEENTGHRSIWELRAEQWSLHLGIFTNRLGQNWLRPLFQVILITIAFFPFLIIVTSQDFTLWPFGNEPAIPEALELFWQHRGVLPQLFNPTRYLTRVFGVESLPGDVYFIDVPHRIILAFYIYQIISAFRKYFK